MNRIYKLTNKIRDYRIANNLTQRELALLVGVSKNSISSYETGGYFPSAAVALLLCNVFRVEFFDLFYLEVIPCILPL